MRSAVEEVTANAEAVTRDSGIEVKRDGSVYRPPTAIDNVRMLLGHTLVSIPMI